MTRKCYDKETRGHWDNGTNELLAPLTLVGRRGCPFGTTPRPVGRNTSHNDKKHSILLTQ